MVVLHQKLPEKHPLKNSRSEGVWVDTYGYFPEFIYLSPYENQLLYYGFSLKHKIGSREATTCTQMLKIGLFFSENSVE